MNILILVTAIFVGVFGILLIIAPKTIIRVQRLTDSIVETDPKLISRRFLWGVLLILAGVHMIYVWMNQ